MGDAMLMEVCVVGGNAVSAFLSWRLQATNACDVTLVWKSGFDAVSQYGISFKSTAFGNERFKPRHVVRTPEDAAASKEGAFDYVLLCVKALPDIYDLAAVIESVVTPQHTCILVNTTHTLGVEAHLEQRFPTNVVLSLVSGAELTQLGVSEFEHKASTEVWVGAANKNAAIPASIQQDMAEALAMTLSTGQVDCKVSRNIRQQQYERMIGPIAFHPLSVLMETPSHAALLEKTAVLPMIKDVMDELLRIAEAQGCTFPKGFTEKTLEEMVRPSESNSIMYQDFMARRPMEVETYLGSPIKLAQSVGLKVPRIETLYALLHSVNIVNQQKPKEAPVTPAVNGNGQFPTRLSSAPTPRPMNGPNGAPNGMPNGMMNGMGRGRGRAPSMGPPPGMRRGGPMNGAPNGYGRPPPNGYGSRQQSRRGSIDNELADEFSHVVLYDDIPEGVSNMGNGGDDMALRERELMLRQREINMREQEMRMRRGPPPGPRRGGATPSIRNGGFDDDDDDDDEYFDPTSRPAPPLIDPDNFDMMSVTSRRNRKAPSISQSKMRSNPEGDSRRGYGQRPMQPGRNRSSARLIGNLPGTHDSIMDDPLMGYSSNRYGNVDRQSLGQDSRAASLTSARLDELQFAGGHMNGPFPRRTSQSPGNPYSPQLGRGNGRPSPPNGHMGYPPNGRPSPPGGMRQPIPQYPPGQGNMVAPQQVEQHAGRGEW
ncbi:hypothetical protein V499_05249 [Pseudogymnoascus sp. VKM F-103]|nr:hypothetical protein V499_05249 [Pseudogymnoascus sp. VKM F-103]